MVMLKSLFLVGLMLASAYAETSKPTMATLQVKPNFDFGLTNQEFRVHYSGLGNDYTSTSEDAIIKIYKKTTEDSQEVISYTVDASQKNQKKAYYFALKGAEGSYEVEVCAGATSCSGRTPALTDIKSEQYKLACEEGIKQADGSWEKREDFELNFMGPLQGDWVAEHEYSQIESELNAALRAANLPDNYKTDYNRHQLQKNPTYKDKVFYVALKYNVVQYKRLFDKKRTNEQRSQYAHDFCKRKYLLSAHAHLVNKSTKEVEYRFKTTLYLSGVGKQYYVLSEEATQQNRKVHVEMTHPGVDIADGTYELHVAFCATEKDSVDSTFCADPIVHTEDFVVKNGSNSK